MRQNKDLAQLIQTIAENFKLDFNKIKKQVKNLQPKSPDSSITKKDSLSISNACRIALLKEQFICLEKKIVILESKVNNISKNISLSRERKSSIGKSPEKERKNSIQL